MNFRSLAILALTLASPAAAQVDSALFGGLRYRMIGPSRGGRVTTVTGVPSQPLTFYQGSTGGGVWKTTNAGTTWENVSDAFFGEASMGSVEVSLSDPNVVWAGTGSEGIRSNVSTGRGVYRSTDAGATWRWMGLREAGQIGAVRIHPSDPRTVFVAAVGNAFRPNPERGVYRTRDGGETWEKVLFVSDSTGAVDLEFQPGNPDVVYASMWRGERKPWTIISGAREGGIYRSTDGGTTWTKLGGGLPTGLFGKSNVAVSAANPRRVYALVEASPGGGLYRSDDAGETWTLVSTERGLITRPFYSCNITADPTNADVVYVGTESFYKSTDGGRTWRTQGTPHGDNHDLWINPRDARFMIQSNDGGANVTLDGGRTWSTQLNQPTAEIYQVYTDSQFPYRVYGAQQDNTTLIVASRPLQGA
ncbi:MAG: WD40/YVTN/BNR-like repeat-containing protein, partial [Longimicrobiaceae bacterium]